ncbi:MBL fold metallo-hydrolase [Methanobrevibacter sp. DSM 116169]|uniref:MBL fold metallo-hydrolase n=1 Tax=Methanobrevibacter sp. DSM 116169 TaxID=3242727 RepID=UPI0038FBECF0
MAEIKSLGNMSKAYLIKENNKSVLIDTGASFDKKSIYNSIKDENVQLIILTHNHSDHTSNANFLAEKLNIPLSMTKIDYENMNNEIKSYPYDLFGRFLLLSTKLLDSVSKKDKLNIDFFIKNNDNLKDYGIDAKIYSLPGHTAGSIGIMVDNDKFIVGDAMMNHFSPSLAKIFENKKEMLKSVDFIKNSEAVDIFTGHGKPFKNK